MQGAHVDGAIYVIHQGSVNFYRAAPGRKALESLGSQVVT